MQSTYEVLSECVLFDMGMAISRAPVPQAPEWPEPSGGPVQMLGVCASTTVCATKSV